MIAKFNHFSRHQCEIPEKIIAAIVKAVQPEKIICYGVQSKTLEAWSCFVYPIDIQISTVYNLLIITMENEKRKEHELLDKIHYINTEGATITAVVHSISAVNEALKNGSTFFVTLYHTGILLYDNQNIPLLAPLKKEEEADHTLQISMHWNKWFALGQKFLKGASYCSSAGWSDLAVFMLHQAVEHACIALIRVYTGYRPATHSLSRLLALTENFSLFPLVVFPRNTKEEMDLFNTLACAYSDVRYKEEYKITGGKVITLMERVTTFQSHAEALYRSKSEEIKNGSTNYTTYHVKEFNL